MDCPSIAMLSHVTLHPPDLEEVLFFTCLHSAASGSLKDISLFSRFQFEATAAALTCATGE